MKVKVSTELASVMLLLLGGAAFTVWRSFPIETAQNLPLTAYFEMDSQRIDLEIAKTRTEQAKGLQFREVLQSDRGMLFPVEPAAVVQLWMKGVNFPLDMLFLREGTVIEIAEQVPPCETAPCPLYGPDEEVDAVVEVVGGSVEQLGIEEGDHLEIQFQ